jgi:hypothetical protein
MIIGRPPADQAGARTCTVPREGVQDMRRICSIGGVERIPTYAGQPSGSVLSFYPLHTNDLS